MELFETDTIHSIKEKLDAYYGQADGGCGETGGAEEVLLHQAINRYVAEEIISDEHPFSGRKIINRGCRITIKEVGLLAALGYATVQVYSKPIVSIVAAGQNLVSIFEEPGLGQVRDINAYTLMALLEKTGAKVGGVSLVRDVETDLNKTLKDAVDRSDIVIVCGETNENKAKFSEVMESLGSPGVITHELELEPIKECMISVVKDEHCCCCSRSKLAVALSADPIKVMLSYRTIIDYFIKKYYFKSETTERTISAPITQRISSEASKESLCLVKMENKESVWTAEPIDENIEGLEQLMVATGYIKISGRPIESGEWVEVFLL